MNGILIMGGTEFVSSSLGKYLVNKGYQVDILTRGIKSIENYGFRKHIICNRKSFEGMEQALSNREYEYIFDISAYTREDVNIILKLINREKLKKYIFCSSGAVYKPSDELIEEDFEKGENPNWGKYGVDKKEAEECIINSGIPYVIFRPTYIYGEGNNLYREAYFFDRIKENKIIPIPYGNNTKTQFIHIDDLVRVFESAMQNSNSCKIYNLTNPEIISWEDYIRACGVVMEKEPAIKRIDKNIIKHEVRSYFPFRDVTYMLDIKRLINDGLYKPDISLKEGLTLSYKWYLDVNPNICDFKMDKVEDVI